MSWGINVHNFDSLLVVSMQSNFVKKHAEGFVASVPSFLGKNTHVCGKRAKFFGQEYPCLWQACQVFRGKHVPGFVASVPRFPGQACPSFCGKRAKEYFGQACPVFFIVSNLGQADPYYYWNDFMLAFCPIWELAKVCGNKYSGLTVPTNHNNVSLIVSVSYLRIIRFITYVIKPLFRHTVQGATYPAGCNHLRSW